MQKLLVISDLHCGSQYGLIPPEYRTEYDKTIRDSQRKGFNFYMSSLKKIGPVDFLLINGDAIDGAQQLQKGRGQISIDPHVQVEMAQKCIEMVDAKRVLMTTGTSYHIGKEDYEEYLAKLLGIKKEGHLFKKIEGVIVDAKHHLAGSTVPYGVFTPLAKEWLHNLLWAEKLNHPKSDLIIRSHVHSFRFCGTHKWMAMATPALQSLGSEYGVTRCSGTVDFGLVLFEISGKQIRPIPFIKE